MLLQHLYASFISPKRSYWYVLITTTVQCIILRILVSLTFCQALSLSAAIEVVIPFARAAGSSAVYSLVFGAVVVSAVVCAVDVRGVVVLLSVRAVVVSAAVVADAVVI
jgi:hypothetical protein